MENLKDIVIKAKEAVEGLEEPLRTQAFNKILDRYLDNTISKKSKPRKEKRKLKTKVKNKKLKKENEILKKLEMSLNRTKYPEIYNFRNNLDNSLFLLKIARDENGINELSPPQISYLLTNIFGIKATKESVSMALKEAKTFVDRKRDGNSFLYKIMKSGEDHLSETISKNMENKK